MFAGHEWMGVCEQECHGQIARSNIRGVQFPHNQTMILAVFEMKKDAGAITRL
jgi:hypothetical protein